MTKIIIIPLKAVEFAGLLALLSLMATAAESNTKDGSTMLLTSPAFEMRMAIPTQYTCDGLDGSPPLQWKDLPMGTKSLALIADDPDAPRGTWVHWVLYNLPATEKELPEGIPAVSPLPNGAIQGINDSQSIGYSGPCPPSGTHRYFFKLYALDSKLGPISTPTKANLEKAMEGHILGKTELMGTYRRK